MICPKCGKTLREHSGTSMPSTLTRGEAIGENVKGYECAPAGCGYWAEIHVPEPPKLFKKQFYPNSEVSNAVKTHLESIFTEIRKLRIDRVSWQVIKNVYNLPYSLATLGKHYTIIEREKFPGIQQRKIRGTVPGKKRAKNEG